jgi:hypothetical protein
MADVAQQLHVASLRAQLASERSEKDHLLDEITAPSTSEERKYEAIFRYSLVNSDSRKIARNLDMFEDQKWAVEPVVLQRT